MMATTTATSTSNKPMQVVVVVRHGERLDYVERDAGRNWVQDNVEQRPWDPPLTERGLHQASDLGEALDGTILHELGLPSIGAVYSSPFLRCRQTAVGILRGGCNARKSEEIPLRPTLKVKVELGLSESINQNWYRSWALPGADGSWGYMESESQVPDRDDKHPSSREPVQKHILDWKQCPDDEVNGYGIFSEEMMDHIHESQTDLDGDGYSYDPPVFESYKTQRARMLAAMNALSERHVNETIVLVSHGGPVTHLYESITGNKWDVHGESGYCCFSVYVREVLLDEAGSEDASMSSTDVRWTPLVVNRSLWDDTSANVSKESFERTPLFQWT